MDGKATYGGRQTLDTSSVVPHFYLESKLGQEQVKIAANSCEAKFGFEESRLEIFHSWGWVHAACEYVISKVKKGETKSRGE